ncbi:MAG: N-acetyl-gamma-glutamyl-phosphate reductase [Phycisphaerales bacterium]|nr:N-acetyl-gamma-glutamyl-phosphate reductase [Phycisphaerales bacterium]
MNAPVTVSIVGASGYAGGELLRLLLAHPHATIAQATSERLFGRSVTKAHPNLRKKTTLAFTRLGDLEPCDLLFTCLPHGDTMEHMPRFRDLAPRVIDLSADFRLNDPAAYERWYGRPHTHPEWLGEFVYGIPELHRTEMKDARYVSSAGCNATATILGLYPLFRAGVARPDATVVEVKVGSSEGGNRSTDASHHPERAGCVRSFMPVRHRHAAEMIQELGFGREIEIHFSATSIEMVRGVLATAHVFLEKPLAEKDIWKIYRGAYGTEPFVRIVKERDSLYRYPEPKLVAGTNHCDVGFELDADSGRLVVMSAIDNLMKGAAGQALQAFNLMHGFDETTGLEFAGLHP